MFLTQPNSGYLESYLEAVNEWDPLLNHYYLDLSEAEKKDIINHIETHLKHAKGEDLPKGYVPHTTYWLVDGKSFYGILDIRHELNKRLRELGGHIGYSIRPSERGKGYGKLQLKLGLEKAKEMGFAKVLVTCDATNTASRRVIETNDGIFEDARKNKDGTDKLRFWFNLEK